MVMERPAKVSDEGTDTRTFLSWQQSAWPLSFIYQYFSPMALTGSDLLAKVKEQGDASKSDLVRAAGYLST